MQRPLLALLAIVLAISAVNASRVLSDELTTATRQLQQVQNKGNARCPDGCMAGFCQQDATMAGLYCTKCKGNLVVNKANGKCACPAGKYSNGTETCIDCNKSYYCIGGDFSYTTPPVQVACPGDVTWSQNMTTLGKRSINSRACVNMPGFSYSVDAAGVPSQTECPVNTYSSGLKKQRACVPCPTGYSTMGATGKTKPTDCYVPPGYYLKAPGQVAPCPKGEYKVGQGPSGNCTKCAFGVTTKLEGSTDPANCTDVIPGYYAAEIDVSKAVTRTVVCPQKYYCQGGTPLDIFDPTNPSSLNVNETTIILCKAGTWTIDQGSTSADQCLTPPGFQTNNTHTMQCPDGYYRADWKPANQATLCLYCGDGVYADKTDQLKVWNITDPTQYTLLPITTSADDCYIKPGQGLYYSTITGAWRARNCDTNNYGVSNITYGLTPTACRDCPANMVAVNNATSYPNSTAFFYDNLDGKAAGFISALACVNIDGYGYNGRVSQACDVGTYNAHDTRTICTSCAFGLTTEDVAKGITEADCGIAAGYGYYNVSGNMTIVPCPIGSYNNVSWNSNRTTECTLCPAGSTTEKEGSDSPLQCSLCAPGYGGSDCSQQCGGIGASATYGPPGRSYGTNCSVCSFAGTGFSFEYNLTNDVYAPKPVSRTGANSSIDCLTEFTQMVDGAWYLPITQAAAGGETVTTGVANFSACLDLCTSVSTCMWATYDYDSGNCSTYAPVPASGGYWDGFKVGPSGDTAVNAFSKKQGAKAKALASGFYSWYQADGQGGANEYQYATAVTPTGAGSFTTIQDCLNACDDDTKCAGVRIGDTGGSQAANAQTCKLIYGDATLGVFKRTMTRTAIDGSAATAPTPGLQVPSALL